MPIVMMPPKKEKLVDEKKVNAVIQTYEERNQDKDADFKMINLRLPAEVVKRCDVQAKKLAMNRSSYIRQALIKELKRAEKKQREDES